MIPPGGTNRTACGVDGFDDAFFGVDQFVQDLTEAVAGIALGLSKDLLQRAAAVTLKEGRPLVVVPREMPLARATLVHLLSLHDAGAIVAPASPGFYSGAKDAEALADFVAAKVLDVIGIDHDLMLRWTGQLGAARKKVSPAD